jgi:hypothetical protein
MRGRCPVGTEIYSIRLPMSEFSAAEAKRWLHEHGFRHELTHGKRSRFWHAQQLPRRHFDHRGFATLTLPHGRGVEALVGCPASKGTTPHHHRTYAAQAAHERNPGPRCPVGTEIHSLLFPMSRFTAHEAVAWLRRHGMRDEITTGMRHSEFWHARQLPREHFDPSFPMRTIHFGDGIEARIGCPISRSVVPHHHRALRRNDGFDLEVVSAGPEECCDMCLPCPSCSGVDSGPCDCTHCGSCPCC